MNNFIYLKEQSIPDELCDDIIEYYNDEPNKYDGVTAGGMNKDVKDTTDFGIPINSKENTKWFKINNYLYNELFNNLKLYLDQLQNISEYSSENNIVNYKMFETNYFYEKSFMVQKYEKQRGKYIYHNDFSLEQNEYRVITYLWYLMDVNEGGETEFWNDIKIKPKKGTLLLFPAHWAFPHCGKMPISSDKIIITGWLYKSI